MRLKTFFTIIGFLITVGSNVYLIWEKGKTKTYFKGQLDIMNQANGSADSAIHEIINRLENLKKVGKNIELDFLNSRIGVATANIYDLQSSLNVVRLEKYDEETENINERRRQRKLREKKKEECYEKCIGIIESALKNKI
jgi:NAD-dependent SIR2 family protein deacetylase